MRMCTVQIFKKTAIKTLFLVSALTAGAFSQGTTDTAKVPFRVNVNAKVTAVAEEPTTSGGAAANGDRYVEKNIRADRVDTLILLLSKISSSVSYRPQGQANAPAALRYSRGNVSLKLHPQQYGSAEISLFSVNGKRVLSGKASASKTGELNISKSNVAAGVYTLLVKGMDGGSFASKMAHHGGKLNVSVSFGSGDILPAAAAGDYGRWQITVSAAGYVDSSAYGFLPDKGLNPTQNITLRQEGVTPPTGQIGCSRAGLEAAVNSYLAAMNAGDYTLMPLASGAKYYENDHDASYSMNKSVEWGKGLWAGPVQHDYHMNLIDVDSCATYTEVIVANQTTQYINGARLKVKGNQISEVWLIVTQKGDWLFNAANYLTQSKAEAAKTDWKHNWSEIPVGERLSREELRTAGNAYLEYFGDKNVQPMWGVPCARLEGGAYTGNNSNSSCDVGIPNTQKLGPFYNLVDVDKGMTVSIFNFGGADSHWFRIVKGHGYRYIHTLTAMRQSSFQGAPPE